MPTDNKKSVAIIVCAWPPGGGGIGNNAYYQAHQLSTDYKVSVLTINFVGIENKAYPFIFKPLKTFLRIGKAGFLLGLWKNLKSYQIINLYYPFFGTDLLIILYKIFHPRVKLVIHYQMDPVASGLKGFLFWLYIKLFLVLTINLANSVGVLSFDHARNSYLRKYLGKNKDKFFELPNGVDVDLFRPQIKDEQLMKLYNFSVHDKIILFVGGLDRQHYFKGLPVLLEAYNKIDIKFFPDIRGQEALRGNLTDIKGEAKILVIGDGDLRSSFENLTQELGISKNVIFVGWIDNANLPKYYALADVFVLPSTDRTESFGIVVAEAQSCSKPVIVSNWPGVRSTLKDGQTGFLVEPNNSDDLCQKIKAVLNNQDLALAFGQAGRARVIEKYAWPKILEILDRIYNQI